MKISDPPSTGATVSARVTHKAVVADGVVTLTLVDPEGRRLPDWTPGSHIDLMLATGDVRQYSLCGDRNDPFSYRVGVLREPAGRGGSAYVHDGLAEGHVVGIGGPRNNFHLVPSQEYLFIAGGIGITPLLPMIEQAELLGAEWSLLYGGRTLTSMAFLDELARHGDKVTLWPQDQCGLLDLAGRIGPYRSERKVYCCGPGPLLAAVEAWCSSWPIGALRIERFVAKPAGPPVLEGPFQVELARSGRTVDVDPTQSVLDAVRRAGVMVLSLLRAGNLRNVRNNCAGRGSRPPGLASGRPGARTGRHHVHLRFPLLHETPRVGPLITDDWTTP